MSDPKPAPKNGAEQIIARLSRLLHDEISAIGAGKLETVRELYPSKVALMQELEEATAAVGKRLAAGGEDSVSLRKQLDALQVLIRKDHALLERMTDATGRVARELARIRDRHGLGGLYESSGTRRKDDVAIPQQVDQSI